MPKTTATASQLRRELEEALAEKNNLLERTKALEEKLSKATQATEEETLKLVRADLVHRVSRLDSRYDVKYAQAAIDCIQRERGSVTPTEQFVLGVLLEYANGWLTPESAARELEQFREEFVSMKDEAAAFVKAYPQEFKDTCAGILKAASEASPAA